VSDAGRGRRPSSLGDVLAGVLADAGITARVEQASVVPDWASLVGPQIASVTEPMSVSADGTLFVAVATHAWMNELSLMEPELLRALNARTGLLPVLRIRLQLRR
jgi:predicted nucleic acid-binding Zn ribbon protein